MATVINGSGPSPKGSFMAISKIIQLAETIHSNTVKVDTHFTLQNLPSPSFDDELPAFLPAEIEGARNAVIYAADELTELMQGPNQLLETPPALVRTLSTPLEQMVSNLPLCLSTHRYSDYSW